MIIFFLMISILSFGASEVSFNFELSRYKLKINDKELIYSNQETTYYIEKKQCNQKLLGDFDLYFNRMITRTPLNHGELKAKVNFIFNGKEYYEDPDSVRGKFLRSLPFEIERIQRAVSASCKK